MRTRIKICGITNPDDARLAADAGADAIGLVFHDPSPRNLTLDMACSILATLPPFVGSYAVVLDPDVEFLDELMARVPVDAVQYHGREAPQLCARFPRPWIKAVPMHEPDALAEYQRRYAGAGAFLLDSHQAGEAGGRGQVFDWASVHSEDPRPLILAGGLTPDNVAAAISEVRPWGVDVSSGVESAPGRKDAARIDRFMQEVRRAAA